MSNYSNQSDEKNFFLNKINFNSINCFSNINNDSTMRMNIDTEKDVQSDSNQSNQTNYYSSLLHEEDQKIKQNNFNNAENNLFIFNNPNEINNFSLNNIQFQKKNENQLFPENNRILSNFNQNSINVDGLKNSGNQSRFINMFKMNNNNNDFMSSNTSFDNNNKNNFIQTNTAFDNNSLMANINNFNKSENSNYIYDCTNNENLNNFNGKNNKFSKYNKDFKYSNDLYFTPPNNEHFNNNCYNNNNIRNVNTINNINNNNYKTNIKLNQSNNVNNDNSSSNIGINNIVIPTTIINRNIDYQDFLNYVNNLDMPLIKLLCTKKGITEMKNYLSNHKYNNIEILLYLLNKEGLNKLMKHKFGNYFIQEIIKEANYPQMKLILELISQNFVEISKSNSGTHVLQTLLDKVNSFDLRDLVLKSIENKELEMAFNNNATYVLQKIIGIIPDNERLNMNEIIINNLIVLALDSECVFIVEKFISTITIKENKNKIKNIICENCIQLATSPFGNYLIQYLFQLWKDSDIEQINKIIIDNANFLVKQRYSSNVIEKAIDIYDNKTKPILIRSLCLGGDILEVIKNQYGHYVLNKAVKYMDEGLKTEIETILNNQMTNMNKKEKTKSKKFIAHLKKNGKTKNNYKASKK